MVMQAHEELGQRLSALRADFAALGTRAADAASALAAKLPPPPALLDELTGADEAFTELREAMLQHAGSLALDVDTERVGTLRDLEEVLTAIAAAEERQVQVHEWEEARDSVLQVLDQVMALVHREDRMFGALADCQARARELHGELAALAAEDLERETAEMSGKARPFRDLLALVDGWNVLDDDRCAFLQDALTQAFGRPLALAALRGKLAREGELPEPTRGRGVSREPSYPSGVYSPSGYAPPPAYPAVGYVPADDDATYPAAHATPPAETTHAGAAAYAAAGAPAPPAGIPHPGLPPRPIAQVNAVDIRLSGDKIDVETPEARKDREKQLERLAQESAQWWISARNGWRAMRERGASFADAARDFLQRYPTLLSVPLPKSAEAGGRHVAEGYALLLAHIEKMEEGFVREALTRLNPQFTTGDGDKAYQLAQELYLYIVAEGRLYKTYPDFVRDVLVNALPASGPWVQGGLIEGDDATRRFMRGEEPGAREEHTDAVTGWQERIGPHVFTISAGPLTTRFFTLGLAGDALADPPDVEIKLKENDAATDHAWLLTLPMAGTTQPLAAKRHRTGGTTLTGLGRELGGLWIGLFNADPGSDRSYELSITLRRKPPAAAPKGMKAPAPSPTAGKFFGKR
jgi:hypothetical protein